MANFVSIYTKDNRKIIAKKDNIKFNEKFIIIELDEELRKLNNVKETETLKITYDNVKYILE